MTVARVYDVDYPIADTTLAVADGTLLDDPDIARWALDVANQTLYRALTDGAFS